MNSNMSNMLIRNAHLPLVLIVVLTLVFGLAGQVTAEAYVSVKDYGAVGDGIVNDTRAIQNALNAGKGSVYLPHGTYRLTSALIVPSNSGIIGPGTLHQTVDVTTIFVHRGSVNIVLTDFTVMKDFVDNSLANGILIDASTSITISGVEVSGMSARHGIEIRYSSNFLIDGNLVHDFSASEEGLLRDGNKVDAFGIYCHQSTRGQIVNNRIMILTSVTFQTDGITIADSEMVVVANNFIENVGEGIDVMHSHNCTIVGNVITNTHLFGIKLVNGSSLNTVSGNTIKEAGLAGIALHSGTGNVHFGQVVGNVVMGNIVSEVVGNKEFADWPTAGILVADDGLQDHEPCKNVIVGNSILGFASNATCKYGIHERGRTYGNIIVDNLIQGVLIQELKLNSR
jgi:parallel beta-helix repeat protein